MACFLYLSIVLTCCFQRTVIPCTPAHRSNRAVVSLPRLQDLARCLWALGTLRCPLAPRFKATLLAHVAARLTSFGPRELANVLWALGWLEFHAQMTVEPLLEPVSDTCSSEARRSGQGMASGGASGARWAPDSEQEAYSTDAADSESIGSGTASRWSQAAPTTLQTALSRAVQSQAHWSPQELSNVAWALARMRFDASRSPAGWAPALVRRIESQLPSFKPQEVAMALWAVARLRLGSELRAPAAALAATLRHLPAFRPQELMCVAWAARELKLQPSARWFAALESSVSGRLGSYDGAATAHVVRALSLLGYSEADAFAARCLEAAELLMAQMPPASIAIAEDARTQMRGEDVDVDAFSGADDDAAWEAMVELGEESWAEDAADSLDVYGGWNSAGGLPDGLPAWDVFRSVGAWPAGVPTAGFPGSWEDVARSNAPKRQLAGHAL